MHRQDVTAGAALAADAMTSADRARFWAGLNRAAATQEQPAGGGEPGRGRAPAE